MIGECPGCDAELDPNPSSSCWSCGYYFGPNDDMEYIEGE